MAREYSPAVVESLLRLGALAADAQDVIESLAGRLLDDALIEQTPQRVVLTCEMLQEQHRHLVRELFVVAWRRQGWPRQAMGMNQWEQLADLATCAAPRSQTIVLPGAIRVERCGERISLSRSDPSATAAGSAQA